MINELSEGSLLYVHAGELFAAQPNAALEQLQALCLLQPPTHPEDMGTKCEELESSLATAIPQSPTSPCPIHSSLPPPRTHLVQQEPASL